VAVISLSTRFELAKADSMTLTTLHYASPRPMRRARIHARARELMQHYEP
jgi:hypothetical protein